MAYKVMLEEMIILAGQWCWALKSRYRSEKLSTGKIGVFDLCDFPASAAGIRRHQKGQTTRGSEVNRK